MRISEFLNESTIKVNLEARSKTVAIEELVDLLVEQHEISLSDRATVIESVMAREKTVSTGMENGIAIPHGAVDSIDNIVASLGVKKAGLDFQSFDGKPAHIIILLALPAGKTGASVQTMAGISRIMTHRELRERILDAETPEEVMDIIIEEEDRQFLEEE